MGEDQPGNSAPDAFRSLRKEMMWSRDEVACFLGMSKKAIESYEQGWRNVPGHAWRLLLTLAAIQRNYDPNGKPCWEYANCPEEIRKTCFCFRVMRGSYCWMTATKNCHLARAGPTNGLYPCLECPVVEAFMNHTEDKSRIDFPA